MNLILFIVGILVALQLLLALNAIIVKRGLERRYNIPLSLMVEAATVLEEYSRIYRPVNIKVDANISLPAIAKNEFVLINKRKIYKTDLFTVFFLIFQLELSRKNFQFINNIKIYQSSIFIIGVILLVATFISQEVLSPYFLYAAFAFQIFSLLLTFYAFVRYNKILNQSTYVAYDLLNLDEKELAYSAALKNDIRAELFEYPITSVFRIIRFFLPI